MDNGSRFQILALDGGGLKGIFPAAVLAGLEQDLETSIADHFDLIAGTSTGGIIALALGAGISPKEVVEFYATHGPRIFRNPFGLRNLLHWTRSKYAPGPLRHALEEIFGDRTLSDSRKRLVIPAFDLGEDDVYLFKTPHHDRLKRDFRERLSDVAMATAAAPTFFPAFSLRSVRLVDGGVWANNPAAVAVAEAVSMCGAPLESVRVFSLGTTTDLRHRDRRLDRSGIIRWATSNSAIDIILLGQSIGANNLLRHMLGEDRLLRVDPKVPAGLLHLDRLEPADLIGKAASASRTYAPFFEKKFADHHASDFTPLYPRTKESVHA